MTKNNVITQRVTNAKNPVDSLTCEGGQVHIVLVARFT